MPILRQDVSKRGHLDFLYGLRGIAALYVVMFHAAIAVVPAYIKAGAAPFPFRLLLFGHFAVVLFIVISGFCLMLPIARSSEMALQGGLRTFFLRRALRILPPYYAVLVASSVVPILMIVLKTHHRPQHWLMSLCRISGRYDLLAHIALVHNLRSDWCQNILPPLWSIATEWQIYFLFALLLLPVLRRWGTFAALAAAIVICLTPSYLLRFSHNLTLAFPWFLILFAIGMIGAMITRKPRDAPHTWCKNLLYRLALPCLALLFLPDFISTPTWYLDWKLDIMAGLLAIWLILAAYHQTQESPSWVLRSLLEMRPLVALGRFSYSLYLTHYLVLAVVVIETASYHLTPAIQASLNLLVGTPLSLVCAWAFYLVFERPFQNRSVVPANATMTAHTIKPSVPV